MKHFIFLLLLIFLGCEKIFAANIIFDMHGVLVKQSGAFFHIGPTRFFGFFNPLHIEDTFFDFLNSLMPLREDTPHAIHKGRRLPQIMCDFHTNLLSAEQIMEMVVHKLNSLAPGIDNPRKVKLLHAIADFIFSPKKFVQCITPLKKGVKILKKCYRQKDKNGNRIHKIFVISNWDYESFLLMQEIEIIKKFLAMCDGVVTSALCGHMKPDKEIFEFAFSYFGIDPNKELTFFIDDEEINIIAARSLNKTFLRCIHCNNFDFSSVDEALRRIGIY